MHPSWRIPAEVEAPFRAALGHASTRSISELHSLLEGFPREQLEGGVGLCGLVSTYTAIDVVERRWPTDTGMRRIAQKTTEGTNRDKQYGVTEQNLYLWLSECALGFKPYAEIFDDIFEDPYEFMAAPFFFTINLMACFAPKEQGIWEFLEVIEDACEKAWLLDLNLLPALMVRARMPQPEQAPGADTAQS